jgi:2-methylcitrate dehydratase
MDLEDSGTNLRMNYLALGTNRRFADILSYHLERFKGPYGLEQMFAQPIPVDWEDTSLDIVKQTIMKKYCSLIHGQPVLEAVLDLKRRNRLPADEIEHIRCNFFKPAFDFAGGGSFGPKDHPEIKEQGDYNLNYLVAAALLDDQVGPAQLEKLRIQAPNAQALLARVEVHPDERFSARYPRELSASITISHQRRACLCEGAARLRGRAGQSYVVGPHGREAPLAE